MNNTGGESHSFLVRVWRGSHHQQWRTTVRTIGEDHAAVNPPDPQELNLMVREIVMQALAGSQSCKPAKPGTMAVCTNDRQPAALHVRLLGGFEATYGGTPLIFRSEKVRALFAYLLVEHDVPHRRNRLAALLWGEQDEAQALVNLRMTLLRLREALAPIVLADAIHADRFSIAFRLPGCDRLWCDVLELEHRIAEQVAGNAESACRGHVLDLARGDFLAGLELRNAADFEEWTRNNNALFQQRLIVLAGRCAEALSARNEHERAIEAARALVTLDPWREESHHILMRVCARAGRCSSVIRQYQELDHRLRTELGIPASAESQALLRELLSQRQPAGALGFHVGRS